VVTRLKDGEQALQFIFCRDGYSERRPEMPRLMGRARFPPPRAAQRNQLFRDPAKGTVREARSCPALKVET
jgi:hypothetical protein